MPLVLPGDDQDRPGASIAGNIFRSLFGPAADGNISPVVRQGLGTVGIGRKEPTMTGSPAVCRAIEKAIRTCGFNTEHRSVMRIPEQSPAHVVNAVDRNSGKSLVVMAANEQVAWLKLARQCGIDLDR